MKIQAYILIFLSTSITVNNQGADSGIVREIYASDALPDELILKYASANVDTLDTSSRIWHISFLKVEKTARLKYYCDHM